MMEAEVSESLISIIEAQDILRDIGFPVIGEPVALSGGEENQRSIAFLVGNN